MQTDPLVKAQTSRVKSRRLKAFAFNDLYDLIRPPICKVKPITCIQQVIGAAARFNDGFVLVFTAIKALLIRKL